MQKDEETDGFGVILWGVVAFGAVFASGVLWLLFGSR